MINGEQFEVLTEILKLSGPSAWSGALESVFKSPGKTKKKAAQVAAANGRIVTVIDRLEEMQLIGQWRTCEDTQYYVVTPEGMTQWWFYVNEKLTPGQRRKFM